MSESVARASERLNDIRFLLRMRLSVCGGSKDYECEKELGLCRLMNILTPSEYRVGNPVCQVARKCGGCQIQEMKYDRQLEFKNQKVRGNLMRIGEVPEQLLDQIMEPIVGMDETEGLGGPYHYRNKAQFPIGTDKEGNVVTGFYAGRTHSLFLIRIVRWAWKLMNRF